MDLDDHCNEAAIVKELRQYDARVLMFLRRLCRLEISVKHEQKESSRSSRLWAKINKNTDEAAPPLPSRDAFAKVFTRMGQGHFSSGPSIMNLAENDDVKQYLVWRHTAEKLPPETRRPGMSRSEVVLAFPLCQDGQTPEIAPQSVYAFLPIRQYGFDFLLQADFLLSTNREDILVDSPWNQTLASAVSDAFVNAVVGMSGFPKGNILRYAWISYLPSTTPLSPLMRDIRDDIFRRLRNTPVIHTQQVYGKLRSPVGLTIVPDLYRDPDGVPFALSGDGRGFVSREYSWVYSDAKNSTLEQLGVKTMNDEDFMALMVAVLGNDPVAFYRGKTPEWHASFCNSLHTTIQNTIRTFDLLWTSTPTSQHLLDLPIIPLRGGTWATPLVTPWESPLISTGSTIHYADTSSGAAEIPEGIFIRVVDPEAACNPDRRRLFDLLGVTKMNDSTIRTAIICTHTSETFKPDSLEPRVLASHLAFMFYSGWKTDAHKTCDFWVASAKGECRLASTMYIPSNAPGAAYRVLSQAGRDKDCRFLHPAYMDQVVEKEKLGDWMGWLLENTKIALHPRIYNSGPATLSVLHPDFRPLLESNVPSMRVLTLLRDGWDYYKAFLDISIKAADSIIPYNRFLELSELVRDVVVPCRGSTSFAPLRSTYMPNSSLASQYLGLVPLLDLPDLENPTWAPVLKGLRIQDEPDLRFYLECLRGCRNDPNVSVGTVQTLMRNIETEAANDLVELR